ncbi:MAG: Secretion system C-terminal sorting domain, partial [Bacteroidota bacterium]
CPNTKNTSSSISVDRAICGALRYEWEFTQQLPSVQPAVTVLGGLNTTAFFLNNVPGMGTGKTYNVRARPIHTNGEVGSWGSVQCLKTGTAVMVMQSENAEAWANHDSPELGSRYTLYPNPTSTGRFILTASHTSDEEVKSIKMMDITGKVVFQTQVVMNNNTMEIEFGDLASGVYVVMVGEERLRLIVE